MSRSLKSLLFCGQLLLAGACGNPTQDAQATNRTSAPASLEQVMGASAPAKPPFAVEGEAQGLLLVWYDADGAAHSAESRAQIPDDRRAQVRVDSLEVPPEARLDPAFMYVADLRAPGADGRYGVRQVSREAFEAALMKPAPAASTALAAAKDEGVIIYGASWCGACRQAAGYLRQKNVPFIEKDIEKEPGARSEMAAKAKAQGLRTSGIPVIDVYGTLMGGFSPSQLDALLARK
ncbi:MAG: glutaredoxin domain-containing protein [Myxococcales bacterium]